MIKMFGSFRKKKSKESAAESFWKWFLKKKTGIENFINSDHSDYRIFQELTNKMKEYDEFLFPELSLTNERKYVLIITPDGIEEGIRPTQQLWESRPELENWIVNKFRQPRDEISLSLQDLEYPSSDIEIVPLIDRAKDKVDIKVFIKNMEKDQEKRKHLAFLYLDHILGEFNTITRVGHIEFSNLNKGQNIRDSISIRELRKLIERELY